MPGFKPNIVVRNLLRVVEWMWLYLYKNHSDRAELFYRYSDRIPRKYLPVLIECRSILWSLTSAYHIISRSVGVGVLTSLFSFLLLTFMPRYPVSIPAVFGGGISLAFITLFLPAWIKGVCRSGASSLSQGNAHRRDDEPPFEIFTLFSWAGTFVIFGLLIRNPRIVVFPYALIVAATSAAAILIIFAFIHNIQFNREKIKVSIRAFFYTDFIALLLILMPTPENSILAGMFLTANLFFAFFNAYQLLAINLEMIFEF